MSLLRDEFRLADEALTTGEIIWGVEETTLEIFSALGELAIFDAFDTMRLALDRAGEDKAQGGVFLEGETNVPLFLTALPFP